VSSEQLDSGLYVGVAAEYVAVAEDAGDLEVGAGNKEVVPLYGWLARARRLYCRNLLSLTFQLVRRSDQS